MAARPSRGFSQMKCGDGPEEASHASEAPVSPAPAAVTTTITTQASRCRQCSEEPVRLPWQVPSRTQADGPGAGSQPGTGAGGAQQSFPSVSSQPRRFTDPLIRSLLDLHWGPACSQVDRILLSIKLPKEFRSNHLHLCGWGHASQVWSGRRRWPWF